MSSRVLVAISLATASFAACASQVPIPTPQQAESAAQRWPGTTKEDLAAGRSLYVERCSGCHSLPVPDAYKPEAWPKVIDEMSDRAKLTHDERTRVLRYLVTVTSGPQLAGK